MRILVVDDEPSVRDALDRALRMDGYRSSSPPTAARRSTRSPTTPPDAIVLDVLMPEPDGLEVCRRLRAAGDRTPVLMLTARDAVADRVAGLDAGADDYLVKPFALEELLRAAAGAAARAAAAQHRGHAALRATSSSTRPATPSSAAGARSSSPAPSSCCWSCSCATRARC